MLHKFSAVGSRRAKIDCLDEAGIIFQVSAQDLLRQFVGFQTSLSGNLGQLGFLFGLKTYFHGHSLGRFARAVKRSGSPRFKSETWGTRRDPRVALSIVDFHNPYQEAHLRGRVVERRPDNDFQYLDAISHKYTGKPFPFRTPEGRVALVIEIDKARYSKLPFEHTPAK